PSWQRRKEWSSGCDRCSTRKAKTASGCEQNRLATAFSPLPTSGGPLSGPGATGVVLPERSLPLRLWGIADTTLTRGSDKVVAQSQVVLLRNLTLLARAASRGDVGAGVDTLAS